MRRRTSAPTCANWACEFTPCTSAGSATGTPRTVPEAASRPIASVR